MFKTKKLREAWSTFEFPSVHPTPLPIECLVEKLDVHLVEDQRPWGKNDKIPNLP
jgi:hypothetical protein